MLGKCSTTELPLASSLGLSNASFQLSLYSGWAIHNPYHREITQILFWTALSFCLFLQILFFKGCKTNKPTTEINQTPKTYCLIFKENFELKKKITWYLDDLYFSSTAPKVWNLYRFFKIWDTFWVYLTQTFPTLREISYLKCYLVFLPQVCFDLSM